MGATPNLAIPHIAANQNQKEVTANNSADALDGALCGLLPVAMPDANVTLTPGQALPNAVLIVTGTLTADRNLIVPTNKKFYVVRNGTTGGHNVVIKTAAGTGITVAAADGYAQTYCDATNVVRIT